MTCTRCEGLMVSDELLDLQESYHPMRLEGHRCLSCGNIVDPLIQRHRMVQNSHLYFCRRIASGEAVPLRPDQADGLSESPRSRCRLREVRCKSRISSRSHPRPDSIPPRPRCPTPR